MSGYFECNSADLRFDGARDVVSRETEHLKDWRGRHPVNGLALSGGGIRSASYCLGALQAFAHEECLPGFDYLSTVSGGGYIGASLSYLLSQPESPGRDMPRFDVSRRRFPYLSYPMVGAPMGTPGEREAERWKGRLLRRLRQNTGYLTPGGGINLLSLSGVFLRNCFTSVLVHAALIVLMLQALISLELFKLPPERPDLALPDASGDNLVLAGAGIVFLAYVVVSLLYVLLTAFFDPIEGRWPDAPYRFRRFNDIAAFVLLASALGACAVGLVPVVHDLILNPGDWLPSWNNFMDNAAAVTGAVSALSGAIGMAWGLVQTRSAGKPKISPAIVVPVASFLLLFGVVLIVYNALVAPNVHDRGFLAIAGAAVLVLVLFGWLPDLNYVSLHRYYRDRLMELFMPDPARVWASVQEDEVQGRSERIFTSVPADGTLLGKLCGADPARRGDDAASRAGRHPHEKLLRGPYHLINANVVLVASKHPRYRARGGDNYILSPLYSGSRATGWRRTDSSAENGFTLATAMAASGGAVSPNAGCGGEGITRNPMLSVLMGMFNLRLGYWSPNPYWQGPTSSSRYASILRKPNLINPGLFESFGRFNLHEQGRYVLLTDGGHFENLGLYELVRRRLKLIVVCDAAADADFRFGDLANVIEKVRADFGAIVDIGSEQLAALVPQPPPGTQGGTATARCGYLVAKIHYASPETGSVEADAGRAAREEGTLVYLKATFFKELPADLHAYRREHEKYPHEPTGDQFFDERQFEAYRELGFRTALQMLRSEGRVRESLAYPPVPPPRHEPVPVRVAAFVTVME